MTLVTKTNICRGLVCTFALALLCVLVLMPQTADAAKTSVVVKITGSAHEVFASPDGKWLAMWVVGTSGTSSLTVVSANSGAQQQVVETQYPGGICWIPEHGELFYCVGSPVEKVGSTRVIYYTYDPVTLENTKITHVMDIMPDIDENTNVDVSLEEIGATSPDSYTLDPLAAYDGSVVFHMTRTGISPSFNIYYPDQRRMATNPVDANVGADYDLSRDGTTLHWPLSDEDGNIYIVAYDLERLEEDWHVVFDSSKLIYPADGGMVLKIDSANERAAMLAFSEVVPRLKLYAFGWNEPSPPKVRPFPLLLETGEEILHFDWLGNTGSIYATIHDESTGATSLELLDPVFDVRETLIWGTDAFSHVSYAPGTKTYFYNVVDESGRTPITIIVRAKE